MRATTMLGPVLVLAAVVALLLAAVWLGQRRLIYFPVGVPPVDPPELLPRAEAVELHGADGSALAGWFVPAVRSDGTVWTVVVFNGNAGSRGDRVALGAELASRGLAVLLFDYRGYGGNRGTPTEAGLIEDARSARAWLDSRPEVDPRRIVYFGESLGAAVAVALAAQDPPAALILRSPFTSLIEVGRVHYPWLPVGLLLKDRYPSIERIRDVDCSLLVIAGERDTIVPFEQSRQLFEAASSATKRFVAVPQAEHNDPRLVSGPTTVDEVERFLSAADAADNRERKER